MPSGEASANTRTGQTAGRWCALPFALCLAYGVAQASTTQPTNINLGGTSFYDGFGSVQPGFTYQQYFQIEHFNAIDDETGHPIGLPMFNKLTISSIVSLNQLIYTTPYHLFGGALQIDVLLPLVSLATHNDFPAEATLQANHFGIGDLTFGPALQMPPILRDGRAVFSQRFEFDVITPTGTYNQHADVNQSEGFWSLAPFWAWTVVPTPRFEISARLYYLFNFTNNHPAGSGPPTTIPQNFQAGQAVWANFAASFRVLPAVDVGVNGFAFRQITEDKTDGMPQKGTETTNLSLGPGISFMPGKSDTLFANAYLPVIARNTTHGYQLVFRWIHEF